MAASSSYHPPIFESKTEDSAPLSEINHVPYVFFKDDAEHKMSAKLMKLINQGNIKEAIAFTAANEMQIDVEGFSTSMGCLNHLTHGEIGVDFLINVFLLLKKAWFISVALEWIKDLHYTKEKEDEKILAKLIIFVFQYGNELQKDSIISYYKLSSRVTVNLLADYEKLPVLARANVLTKLICLAVKQYNATLLQGLSTRIVDGATFALNPEQVEVGKLLLSLKDDRERHIIMEMMSEFSYGFGNLTHEGALLTLAQINHRKKNKLEKKDEDFFPVLIKTTPQEAQEVIEFIKVLKESQLPVRVKFIVSGYHWISGEVKIESDGQVDILFIDSLGYKAVQCNYIIDVVELFSHSFPEAKMYYSNLQRQNGEAGCSIFAINDAMHLHTVEKRHLEKKYDGSGLFGYLEASSETIKESGFEIEEVRSNNKMVELLPCDLPLQFMLTMQSSHLYKYIIPSRPLTEMALETKKGKELTVCYVETQFFKTNTRGKKINFLLEKRFKKMKNYNDSFLNEIHESKESKNGSFEQALATVESSFTLEGFKIKQQKRKREITEEAVVNESDSNNQIVLKTTNRPKHK